MADRYFVEMPITASTARLVGAEAHHLLHVMRAKTGTEVTLFDGSGAEFTAQVAQVGRAEVELAILSRQEINRELSLRITLAVALPKGDRQRWLVEKAVELGVSKLVPLETRRGVAQPADESIQRLRRTVIEASKQCGRNRLMEITPGQSLSEFVKSTTASSIRWLAHPGGIALGSLLASTEFDAKREVVLAVGPEGGFTDDEVELARNADWQKVDLGKSILRVETAACFLVSNVACQARQNG